MVLSLGKLTVKSACLFNSSAGNGGFIVMCNGGGCSVSFSVTLQGVCGDSKCQGPALKIKEGVLVCVF